MQFKINDIGMLKFNVFKENSLLESKETQSFIELSYFLKTYEREITPDI
jgi:hypothetical protein